MNIIKDLTTVNYNKGRNGVKYLVLHFTGNANDTARGNANYFRNSNRNASANYFVDSKEIVQVVRDEDTAWHCGDGNGKYGITNSNSIGIEMCGTNGGISEATLQNTIELVKMLMKKYGLSIDQIVRHYDASRKCCPSPMSDNNWAAWWAFKDKVCKVEESAKWVKDEKGWWYKESDGTYPKDRWYFINNEWYYFGSDGYAYESKWFLYNDKWYYSNSDCKMETDKWVKDGDEWFYVGKDGIMLKNTEIKDDGKWYKLNEKGKML